MRREVRHRLAVSALSLPLVLAAAPLENDGPAPDPELSAISDALCDRPNGELTRARSLDRLAPVTVPEPWRKLTAADLDRWLQALPCGKAAPEEATLFEVRLGALGQLRDRLGRADLTEQMEAVVVQDGGRPPMDESWPSAAECPACAALRRAAAALAEAAAGRPKAMRAGDVRIGSRLAAAAKREPLIEKLCAVKPLAGARAEIETGFRYYSWTAGAARLFEVAALFDRLEAMGGCRQR